MKKVVRLTKLIKDNRKQLNSIIGINLPYSTIIKLYKAIIDMSLDHLDLQTDVYLNNLGTLSLKKVNLKETKNIILAGNKKYKYNTYRRLHLKFAYYLKRKVYANKKNRISYYE